MQIDTEEVVGSNSIVPSTLQINSLQLAIRFFRLQNGSTKVQVRKSPFHPAAADREVVFGKHQLDYLGLGSSLVLRERLRV